MCESVKCVCRYSSVFPIKKKALGDQVTHDVEALDAFNSLLRVVEETIRLFL